MRPHQSFQYVALFGQNGHRIGGQSWHGNLLSQLRIRHATTQPIRLLKSLQPRWSQNFRWDVLVFGMAAAPSLDRPAIHAIRSLDSIDLLMSVLLTDHAKRRAASLESND